MPIPTCGPPSNAVQMLIDLNGLCVDGAKDIDTSSLFTNGNNTYSNGTNCSSETVTLCSENANYKPNKLINENVFYNNVSSKFDDNLASFLAPNAQKKRNVSDCSSVASVMKDDRMAPIEKVQIENSDIRASYPSHMPIEDAPIDHCPVYHSMPQQFLSGVRESSDGPLPRFVKLQLPHISDHFNDYESKLATADTCIPADNTDVETKPSDIRVNCSDQATDSIDQMKFQSVTFSADAGDDQYCCSTDNLYCNGTVPPVVMADTAVCLEGDRKTRTEQTVATKPFKSSENFQKKGNNTNNKRSDKSQAKQTRNVDLREDCTYLNNSPDSGNDGRLDVFDTPIFSIDGDQTLRLDCSPATSDMHGLHSSEGDDEKKQIADDDDASPVPQYHAVGAQNNATNWNHAYNEGNKSKNNQNNFRNNQNNYKNNQNNNRNNQNNRNNNRGRFNKNNRNNRGDYNNRGGGNQNNKNAHNKNNCNNRTNDNDTNDNECNDLLDGNMGSNDSNENEITNNAEFDNGDDNFCNDYDSGNFNRNKNNHTPIQRGNDNVYLFSAASSRKCGGNGTGGGGNNSNNNNNNNGNTNNNNNNNNNNKNNNNKNNSNNNNKNEVSWDILSRHLKSLLTTIGIAKKQTGPGYTLESTCLQFHYRFLLFVLLTCYFMITLNWYVQDHIKCAELYNVEKDAKPGYTNICLSYPYVQDKDSDPRYYLLFYRWVPYSFIAISTLVFFLRNGFVKKLEDPRLHKLWKDLWTIRQNYEVNSWKDSTNKVVRFVCSGQANSLHYLHWLLCHFAANIMDLLIIYYFDFVLKGQFMLLVPNAFPFQREPQNFTDPLSRVFPPFVKCQLNKEHSLVNENTLNIGCHLPLMELYEKVFIFVWFVLVIHWLWSMVMVLWLAVGLVPVLGKYSFFTKGVTNKSRRDVIYKTVNLCSLGELHVLYLIKKWMSNVQFENVLKSIVHTKETGGKIEDSQECSPKQDYSGHTAINIELASLDAGDHTKKGLSDSKDDLCSAGTKDNGGGHYNVNINQKFRGNKRRGNSRGNNRNNGRRNSPGEGDNTEPSAPHEPNWLYQQPATAAVGWKQPAVVCCSGFHHGKSGGNKSNNEEEADTYYAANSDFDDANGASPSSIAQQQQQCLGFDHHNQQQNTPTSYCEKTALRNRASSVQNAS